MTGYSEAVLADEPVAYWRLAETTGSTAFDSAGASNGTYVGGSGAQSLLVSDPANPARRFNGVDDHVLIPSTPALDLTGPEVTLEHWINPESYVNAAGWSTTVGKIMQYGFQFVASEQTLQFYIEVQSGRQGVTVPYAAFPLGQASHAVGTFDGQTMRFYVDGVLRNQAQVSGTLVSQPSDFRIATWDGAVEFYKGVIDEVAVYDKALTLERIAAHHAAGVEEGSPGLLVDIRKIGLAATKARLSVMVDGVEKPVTALGYAPS